MSKKKHSPRKSAAQKYAVRRYYAKKKQKEQSGRPAQSAQNAPKKDFPKEFPFWARLKISKQRTTLVIDDSPALDKQKNKMVDGYVHREATSQYRKGFEEISPNPDRDKSTPMYLKSPRKLPKYFFEPHNKDLNMPQFLKERYDKNNHKDKKGQ